MVRPAVQTLPSGSHSVGPRTGTRENGYPKPEYQKDHPVMSFRRIIQLFSLFLFLFLLFAALSFSSSSWPVDLFLRMDPALTVFTVLSARILLLAFLPVLIVLGATIMMGSVLCSHVCPMGTTLELWEKFNRSTAGKRVSSTNLNFLKYLLLAFLFA